MADIDIHYINLDRAPERRANVEKSFAASGFSQRWTLNRFAAVDATSDEVKAAPGTLSDPYKGNYLSHVNCLRQSLNTDKHLFMAEDDIEFCDKTGPLLERVIDMLSEDTWDIIQPEISLMSAVDYPRFYKLRRARSVRDRVKLLFLGDFPFAYGGSGAYIVNRRSKAKLLENLEGTVRGFQGQLNVPFDLCLRGLLMNRNLIGFLTMPFLTAPSIHADETYAPYGNEDPGQEFVKKVHLELINAYRRLLWVGYAPDKVLSPVLLREGHNVFKLTEQDLLFQKVGSWLQFMQYESRYRDYDNLRFLEPDVGMT